MSSIRQLLSSDFNLAECKLIYGVFVSSTAQKNKIQLRLFSDSLPLRWAVGPDARNEILSAIRGTHVRSTTLFPLDVCRNTTLIFRCARTSSWKSLSST